MKKMIILGSIFAGFLLFTYPSIGAVEFYNVRNNDKINIIEELKNMSSDDFKELLEQLYEKGGGIGEWSILGLIFTFLGIHGGTRLPVAFFSFRFWMLFAIPVSIITTEGAFFIANFLKKYNLSKFITLFGLSAFNIVLELLNISAFFSNLAFSRFTPPSTSIKKRYFFL